nr:hypothetical protein [Burkholderia pseudomallei]
MRPGESRKISIPVPIPFSTPLPIRLSATRRAHNRGYCRAEDSERERRHHAFDNHADVDADTGRRRGSAPGSAAPAARDRAIVVKGERAIDSIDSIDAIRSDAGGPARPFPASIASRARRRCALEHPRRRPPRMARDARHVRHAPDAPLRRRTFGRSRRNASGPAAARAPRMQEASRSPR